MQTRALGRSGPQVSTVGLGCNNFGGRIDAEDSRRVIDRAIDLGVTLFDTADIYGAEYGASETILGDVLGRRRSQVVLATKFGASPYGFAGKPDASRARIVAAAEGSLRRLRTDRIDLYQLHLPDPATPIEETLRALEDLVRKGKVRFVGVSNFPAPLLAEALWAAKRAGAARLASVQDEYSLLVRGAERGLLPLVEAEGLGFLPYFPLASGLLTGKYAGGGKPANSRFEAWSGLGERYMTPANLDRVERLTAFALVRGRTLVELAFSWLLARPGVSSVIAGATSPEQVEQNVAAAGWTLSADELAELDRITLGEAV